MVIVPRQFSQVLGDAMNGLAGTWRTLVLPAMAVSIPVSIATIAAFGVTGGAEFLDQLLNNPQLLQGLPEEVFWRLARPFYLAVGIAALLQIAAGVFLALASHAAVAAHLGGTRLTSGQATRIALRRYAPGLGATILIVIVTAILVGLGTFIWTVPLVSVGTPNTPSAIIAVVLFAVLVGPGVWAGVSASMTTSAVAIENRGVLGSIRRSMHLVRGRWWPTAGFLALVGLLGGIAIQLIQLIALPLAVVGDGGAALSIASGLGVLAQGLLVAGIAAMYTYWYIDLRARKESLSTEALS
jgi:hypothetical protein